LPAAECRRCRAVNLNNDTTEMTNLIKRPLNSRRLRSGRLPRGFGWIDHRLLTQGYLSRSSPEALALYCLLICAADSQGLSFYSDERLRLILCFDAAELNQARRELIDSELIAYQKPLYQVLTLEDDRRQLPPEPLPTGRDLRDMVAASLRQQGGAA
jgi:hypothetical protein